MDGKLLIEAISQRLEDEGILTHDSEIIKKLYNLSKRELKRFVDSGNIEPLDKK